MSHFKVSSFSVVISFLPFSLYIDASSFFFFLVSLFFYFNNLSFCLYYSFYAPVFFLSRWKVIFHSVYWCYLVTALNVFYRFQYVVIFIILFQKYLNFCLISLSPEVSQKKLFCRISRWMNLFRVFLYLNYHFIILYPWNIFLKNTSTLFNVAVFLN